MSKAAAQIRQKAALCRRAASIPTEGSNHTNILLLDIAERLDREAATLENSKRKDAPDVSISAQSAANVRFLRTPSR